MLHLTFTKKQTKNLYLKLLWENYYGEMGANTLYRWCCFYELQSFFRSNFAKSLLLDTFCAWVVASTKTWLSFARYRTSATIFDKIILRLITLHLDSKTQRRQYDESIHRGNIRDSIWWWVYKSICITKREDARGGRKGNVGKFEISK